MSSNIASQISVDHRKKYQKQYRQKKLAQSYSEVNMEDHVKSVDTEPVCTSNIKPCDRFVTFLLSRIPTHDCHLLSQSVPLE